MIIRESIACPLCGGESNFVHKGVRDNALINVYQCTMCGIRFLDSFQQNDYELGFMHKSMNQYDMSIEEHLESCKEDDERRFQRMKNICKGKRVLDFGCGYGGYLQRIRNVAEDYCGVELGMQEREYLNSIGIECKKSIDDYDGQFDIVSLFHVFEHLENPREWLLTISEHLASGGYLVIEVPNADDALLSLYNCKAFEDFTYWSAHLILYNEKALCELVSSTNLFRPVDIGFYQRYPIANHLMWLSKGEPGGQNKWDFFNEPDLVKAYEIVLRKRKKCDTLFQIWEKVDKDFLCNLN